MKDEDVVHDIFWSHPHAVKLTNAYNLVFLIDSTYKINDIDYFHLTLFRINNVVWVLEQFRGIFLRHDAIPKRDSTLMNTVKTVFPKTTNLLCLFHIDKNVKAKCKTLVGQKNA
ncbi:hypothetical protein GmHk_05G014646 [Glycine max]|nr:hypothetical protein GmHk_05G014646 [Glycine max]